MALHLFPSLPPNQNPVWNSVPGMCFSSWSGTSNRSSSWIWSSSLCTKQCMTLYIHASSEFEVWLYCEYTPHDCEVQCLWLYIGHTNLVLEPSCASICITWTIAHLQISAADPVWCSRHQLPDYTLYITCMMLAPIPGIEASIVYMCLVWGSWQPVSQNEFLGEGWWNWCEGTTSCDCTLSVHNLQSPERAFLMTNNV